MQSSQNCPLHFGAHNADFDGDEIGLAIKKSQFALDYFVWSFNHRLFAFKNMEPGETVNAMRDSAGPFTMFTIPIDSMLIGLTGKYPTDPRPYKMLGDYYYDVHWKYPQWDIPDSLVVENCIKAYKQAFNNGLVDAESYHNCGLAHLANNRTKASLEYLKRAVQKDPSHAGSHYHMAFAYQSLKDFENSTTSALEALKLYSDSTRSADAAKIIGRNYLYNDEYANALKFYHTACILNPQDYYAQAYRLRLAITIGDSMKALEFASDFFSIDPLNPNISAKINKIYLDSGLATHLPNVWSQILLNYTSDDEAQGNIHFHMATAYWALADNNSAKNHFYLARKYFRNIYSGGHEVFETIQELIKKL